MSACVRRSAGRMIDRNRERGRDSIIDLVRAHLGIVANFIVRSLSQESLFLDGDLMFKGGDWLKW